MLSFLSELKGDENPKDVDIKEKESVRVQDSSFELKTDGDPDKELTAKCVRLILQGKPPLKPPPVKVSISVIPSPKTSPSQG